MRRPCVYTPHLKQASVACLLADRQLTFVMAVYAMAVLLTVDFGGQVDVYKMSSGSNECTCRLHTFHTQGTSAQSQPVKPTATRSIVPLPSCAGHRCTRAGCPWPPWDGQLAGSQAHCSLMKCGSSSHTGDHCHPLNSCPALHSPAMLTTVRCAGTYHPVVTSL